MAGISSHSAQPQSFPSPTGHPLPRRATAANSITLRHHRPVRDASFRPSPGSGPTVSSNVMSSPRRNSSGDSHETGQSDPNRWFDQSNENPTATFDNNVMDVDPPFFQKESDSSNEEKPFSYPNYAVPPRLETAQSSSADDYRSVIDDLTVEIQKLKEELKRYKQKGPDMLRKDKLFEIKIHGLPKRKRRELEMALRDFTSSLQDSPDTSSSQRKKPRHATRDNMYSGSASASKHASSSGSNARPIDSAYASMSTGDNSCGTSLSRPVASSRVRSSDIKVQNYLRDIPEGLYPRHIAVNERERKRLVVRRLEQLFTGKIGGRFMKRNTLTPPVGGTASESQAAPRQPPMPSLDLTPAEPSREARILPLVSGGEPVGKKTSQRANGPASNSNEDLTEQGANGANNGSGATTSLTNMPPPPEQRPTRVKDLDPDRVQVPSENMEYIRHLGLVPPELLPDAPFPAVDIHPDADGWVYLNLLCSLAQLHIINVTPDFVRLAVSEISTKFQLSPDGRKIRWRGGTEGTQFSSDSSGDASQRSPDTDDNSTKEESRKRQKTGNGTGDDSRSGDSSSKNQYKFGPQVSGSSESFHYKPLFVQQTSPNGETYIDDTLSSFGPVDESNMGASGWELSGSGTSNRKKRRRDGAIIYYSGAPFCTDLSGDSGDMSPATHMRTGGQEKKEVFSHFMRPLPHRSESGSSLCYRPLVDGVSAHTKTDSAATADATELNSADSNQDIELHLSWSGKQQFMEVHPLEPCGLGGVLPDDHFMVLVTTKRSSQDGTAEPARLSEDTIINRLLTATEATTLTPTFPPSKRLSNPIGVEYVSGRIKRLAPVALPPPAIFFPPFSSDDSSEGESEAGFDGDDDDGYSSECTSRKANPHQSDRYPDGVDLSSGDEDGEDPDDEPDALRMYEAVDDWDSRVVDDKARGSLSSAEVWRPVRYEDEARAQQAKLWPARAVAPSPRPEALRADIAAAPNRVLEAPGIEPNPATILAFPTWILAFGVA